MTTDTPTQSGGETNTSVEGAAERILGILDAQELPKNQETQTEQATEPTQTDGQAEATTEKEETTSDEGDAQKVEFETLDQLAEATGLPLETLLNLKARANIDGKEDAVPLSEVLKSYQLSKHVNNQSQELANQRKAFEAERENKLKEVQHRLTEAQALSQQLETELVAEYNAIDWVTLRNTDPAEFAARKQEYNERWNRIQAHKNKSLAESYRIQQETAQKQMDQARDVLKAESQKLLDAIPEWKDEAKAKSGKQELRDYLSSMGFSNEDINSLTDHRSIRIIRNAMLYERASNKATIVQKKVSTLPKVMKPGNQQPKDANREKVNESMGRLRKSGKLDDAAAAIERMMK